MKILIAGSSGAIGQPLLNLLKPLEHDVYAITQSEAKLKSIESKGATPLILNVLDREAVFSAVDRIKPDVVIDMLTHLPKEYTPEAMRESAAMNAKLRIEGGGHLLAAAEKSGVRRFIAQSAAFWYAPGPGPADEKASFAFDATPGIASGSRSYAEIERRTLESGKIEGVALRFGFFYGPGTWFHPGGNVADQILKQQFPIIGDGQGIWNFVHIEDAASTIAASFLSPPGAYNIVNDSPSPMNTWLPAFARFLGAAPPSSITEEEGLKTRGPDAVYYATKLRAATNAKAKQLLHFKPRPFEWLDAGR
ncbi:MAG: NAD(P)-dependent oxidoreductase [Verrucomicrobia bacterium]|nr:NAD(P)-dependent oxidoreductase [Verrucomicrobiota bacterium]